MITVELVRECLFTNAERMRFFVVYVTDDKGTSPPTDDKTTITFGTMSYTFQLNTGHPVSLIYGFRTVDEMKARYMDLTVQSSTGGVKSNQTIPYTSFCNHAHTFTIASSVVKVVCVPLEGLDTM